MSGPTVDITRRLQSFYVPMGDGARLAVDLWLPVAEIKQGHTVGTVLRATPGDAEARRTAGG